MTKKYSGKRYEFDRKYLVELMDQAETLQNAARLAGCSFGTIRTACMRLGVKIGAKGRRHRPINKQALKRMENGFSWAKIAERFGCSVTLIKAEFKRFGLTKRDERSKLDRFRCGN